VAERVREALE
jgi:hypothetical protein